MPPGDRPGHTIEYQKVYMAAHPTRVVPTVPRPIQPPTTTPGATSDTGQTPLEWLQGFISGATGSAGGMVPAFGAANPTVGGAGTSTGPAGAGVITGLSTLGKLALTAVAIFGGILIYKRSKRRGR